MRYFFVLFLFLFISCKKEKDDKNVINSDIVVKKLQNKFKEIKKDTIVLNNLKFIIKQFKDGDSDLTLIILNQKLDTIYKHNSYYLDDYKIFDFNKDGFQDVELDYISGMPGVVDVLFFDPKKKIFIIVNDLKDFPDPKKINNSNYYFSYFRSGCADYDWESDLFYISNYKCIKIGNITGRGCKSADKNGIFINKIINERRIEIEWIKRDAGYYEDKWDFIENYWAKNHLKFK